MELNQDTKNSLISKVSELVKSRFPEVESSLENFKFILKQTENGEKDIEVHFDFNDQTHSITYFSEDGEAKLDSEILTVLAVEDGSEPEEETEDEMSEENSDDESEAQEVESKSYDQKDKAVELEENGNQELKASFSDEEIDRIADKVASKIAANQEVKEKAVENEQQEPEAEEVKPEAEENKEEVEPKEVSEEKTVEEVKNKAVEETEEETQTPEAEEAEEKPTESEEPKEESEEVKTDVQPETDNDQEVKNKAVKTDFLKIVKLY